MTSLKTSGRASAIKILVLTITTIYLGACANMPTEAALNNAGTPSSENLQILIKHQPSINETDDHDDDSVDISSLVLGIQKIEAYESTQGWIVIADNSTATPVTVQLNTTGNAAEIGTITAPNGNYEKIRVTLGTENYVSLLADPAYYYPALTHESERHDEHADRGHENNEHSADFTIETDPGTTVDIVNGKKTIVTLAVDVTDLVERKGSDHENGRNNNDRHGSNNSHDSFFYKLENEDVTIANVTMQDIIPQRTSFPSRGK